jgi:hypothetical protein
VKSRDCREGYEEPTKTAEGEGPWRLQKTKDYEELRLQKKGIRKSWGCKRT